MDYISSFGHAAGPIKIRDTWITAALAQTYDYTGHYISFGNSKAYDSSSTLLTPLLAGTPLVGTYKDNGKTRTKAPANAVATVEWVVAYAAGVGNGESAFNPDDYVKRTQLNEINTRLTQAESNIIGLNTRVTTAENSVRNMASKVDSLDRTSALHGTDINSLKDRVTSIETNPFPNGVWFICGDSESR